MFDPDSDEFLTELHQSTTASIDKVFQLIYAAYGDKIEDSDVLYRLFVGILAQTLGRHIAAFPEEQRDAIALEALSLQEEMQEYVIQHMANSEPTDDSSNDDPADYDLSKMTPQGRA